MGRNVMSNKDISSFNDAPGIACEILAYLHDHPDAQDSLEGIMQWWLLEKHLTSHARQLREALNRLVKDGSVIEVVNQSGSFYKLNKKFTISD